MTVTERRVGKALFREMLGLHAMLITSHEQPRAARAEILDNFLATVPRGVESR
ncbi:MAG TPA: hypothetical protein VGG54_09645 [Trebonia sp.]|jgi:hypothetical protein